MEERGINREALYSIGKGFYREPEESPAFSDVTIRFRTLREDVDRVLLYLPDEQQIYPMQLESSDHYFDYYEMEIKLKDKPLHYYFRIEKGEEVIH